MYVLFFQQQIKIEDFDNLIDEKLSQNILVYTFHTKLWFMISLCILCLTKQMDLSEFMMELDI